jgi:hypothetical protein
MATCRNGHENPEAQHFCGECGAALVAEPVGKSQEPPTRHPTGKREHIKSRQRGDESNPVKRPDKSVAESLALAEAEAEVAEAEAAAAAARARALRARNAAASGSQPVAKRSTPKPRQQPPRDPVTGKPVAAQPPPRDPITGKLVAAQPPPRDPVTGKPVAAQPPPRDPITGKLVAAQPRNPLARGLIIVGSLALAIATFLPFDEPVGFHRIQHNTLIQDGFGWILIALAVITAVTGYRVGQGQSDKWWGPIIPCGLAGLLVIWLATDTDLRTLYPVGPDGTIDPSQPGVVTALGIAVYVAGAGVAAALVGAWMLRQTAGLNDSQSWEH